MKTLDRKAAEILRGLLALQTTKVDRSDGTYMPVHIEIIDRTENYNHISLAHYGEQNGDLMRDPEMIFALHNIYPFVGDVMEWWLIDSWLAERLKEQGEVIIEEYGCYWWGRQSSGQAIYMDGVIQEICGND